MRRVAMSVSAALMAVFLTSTPAAAALPSADLAVDFRGAQITVTTVNPNSGLFHGDTGIGYVDVTVVTHNYGPEITPQDAIHEEITAPPGTVFRQLDEMAFRRFPGQCTFITPHTHVRCVMAGSMWLDTYEGGSGGHSFTLYFVLKNKCVSPGSYRLDYPGDPKRSNDSAAIVLKVPGVTAADCAKTKASPKPSRKVSPKPSAARPSASPVEVSPSAVEYSSAPIEAAAGTPTESPYAAFAGRSSVTDASGIALGAAGALVGVALLGGLWLYGRRRRTTVPM